VNRLWLTHSQRGLIQLALKESGWVLTHVGFRDDLDFLKENGFLEMRYKHGDGHIAFRVIPGVKITEGSGGYHEAVREC